MYGREIREQFARAYARMGNATHSLKCVLGDERAGKMKANTLRAKASELLNDYRTVAIIEAEKLAMMTRGEKLPSYRKPTSRTDLISESNQPFEPRLDFSRQLQAVRAVFSRFK